jgi:Protein of unknown function (DUF1822)
MKNLQTIKEKSIEIPLSQLDRETATQFAAVSGESGERVHQNTLAVLAVNRYLTWQGYETNLKGDKDWQVIERLLLDRADLDIVGLGRLECRVVSAGATEVKVPLDITNDRLGSLVMELSSEPLAAKLLGFLPPEPDALRGQMLSLTEMQDMDEFIDRLCLKVSAVPASAPAPETSQSPATKIGQWLQGVIQTGWQTIEQIELLVNTPTFAFRGFRDEPTSATRFGKIFDLGIENQKSSVALVVEVAPIPNEDRTYIRIKVQPTDRDYLPPDLQLSILDDSGATISEVRSRSLDNSIQLGFKASTGSKFAIKIELDNSQIIEKFVI